jgi:hypothetical protein
MSLSRFSSTADLDGISGVLGYAPAYRPGRALANQFLLHGLPPEWMVSRSHLLLFRIERPRIRASLDRVVGFQREVAQRFGCNEGEHRPT